ncbi:MAG: AAA domain-containing protein [Bacteroidota bacterium]
MYNQLFNYFRACYQRDFRSVTLLDFFGKNVEAPLLLRDGELLNSTIWQTPIDSEWGESVAQKLALHGKEKNLVCAAFFTLGQTMVLGRKKKVCAPLYLYPVELVEERDIYYLRINIHNPTINPTVLGFFQDIGAGRYEKLCEALPQGHLDFEAICQLEAALAEHLPQLELAALDDFPQVLDQAQILRAQKKAIAAKRFTVVPALGLALIKKPAGSRGVLNELEEMGEMDRVSQPIRAIWEKPTSDRGGVPSRRLAIPLQLSRAQENILQNAQRHPLSLAIGPPGTGKSFTIAALALEAMSRGQSVLIAAKNAQAVEVVGQKIEADFGVRDLVVKTASQNYQREVKKRLQNWLSGIGTQSVSHQAVNQLSDAIDHWNDLVQETRRELRQREELEINRGGFLAEPKPYFWNRWRKKWLGRKVGKQQPYWALIESLEKRRKARNRKVQQWLAKSAQFFLHQALLHHRESLQSFLSALRARTGNLKAARFEEVDFRDVLDAIPIWITDTSNVHKVLPLQHELFDLVIIDEATQCDIASALPILQRGRRAVIVGDPQQLRHLSFLSRTQQQQLISQHQLGELPRSQLDYRESSLLDLVSDNLPRQQQLQSLDEHYRGMPDLIEFSNREFYQRQLRIMTACPATLQKQHLFLVEQAGRREKDGSNPTEIEAILARVRSIVETEAELSPEWCQSIGILSPFRAQVDGFKKTIEGQFTYEALSRHRILVGTPQSFQGEERDLMFLSLTLDADAHPSALQYLNRSDVFNVSITRARSQQFVFHSFPVEQIKSDTLLGRYLGYIRSLLQRRPLKDTFHWDDTFMEEVLQWLGQYPIEALHKAYPLAGVEVDLVVVIEGKTHCIDLVGYPGEYEEALPMERWEVLSRVGLRTFVLPYSWWVFERTAVEAALRAFLGVS